MEYFAVAVQAAFDMFRMPFTLFGFTFSFWEVLVFMVVASLVIWVVRTLLFG